MVIVIEGGGTHTTAALYDDLGKVVRVSEGGPSNPVAYGVPVAARRIASLAQQVHGVGDAKEVRLYAALAGAFNEELCAALAAAIGKSFCAAEVWVTSDLHAMLHANAGSGAGLLIISGTGAAVLGQNDAGARLRAGGWGTLFGDDGSAYAVAASALRACARAYDGVGLDTVLVRDMPVAAGLTSFPAFIGWSVTATKRDIAGLAPVVANAAERNDSVAFSCIDEEAYKLAFLATIVQEKLALEPEVPFFEYGGLLLGCPLFRDSFHKALLHADALHVAPCAEQGHEAVYRLSYLKTPPPWVSVWRRKETTSLFSVPDTEKWDADTPLDALSARELVARMHAADQDAVTAAGEAGDAIAKAVECAARSLRDGGRIIYAGAGTSGRLGVLDASECPPTFGVSPERVCGLIAGGDGALRFSSEGAEDDAARGAADLRRLQVNAVDFVTGIAASGNTPYVGGVLEAARAAGAATALITSNPESVLEADIRIIMDTGPEVLAGSTRLKAGTAAKLALNMISTGAFTQAGFVYQGRMVGMTPANEKLRQRAARIVAELAHTTESRAAQALKESEYQIATAILMLRGRLSRENAAEILARYDGNLRDALSNTGTENA